jgi:hypothetical protein
MHAHPSFPVTRVPDETLSTSLAEIIDETFPEGDAQHTELRSLGLRVIQQLLEAKTIPEIIQGLDDAAKLNTMALDALGAAGFSPLPHPHSLSPSPPQSSSPPSSSTPENSDEAFEDALDPALHGLRSCSPVLDSVSRADASHFNFTVAQSPERLIVTWEVNIRVCLCLV